MISLKAGLTHHGKLATATEKRQIWGRLLVVAKRLDRDYQRRCEGRYRVERRGAGRRQRDQGESKGKIEKRFRASNRKRQIEAGWQVRFGR